MIVLRSLCSNSSKFDSRSSIFTRGVGCALLCRVWAVNTFHSINHGISNKLHFLQISTVFSLCKPFYSLFSRVILLKVSLNGSFSIFLKKIFQKSFICNSLKGILTISFMIDHWFQLRPANHK